MIEISTTIWASLAPAAGAVGVLLLMVYPVVILRKYIRIMINLMDDCAPVLEGGGESSRVLGESHTFRATDGHRLEGVLVPRSDAEREPAGLVVFGHEFGSDRTSCLRYCRALLDAGYDVFAFDFRNHGQSAVESAYRPRQWPSDRERADMLGAIAYATSLLELQGRPRDLAVFGVSRGAGAAILASVGIENVRAIITDGAFSSDTIMEALMRRFATIFARIRVVAENHPPVFWRFLRWLLFRECACRFNCRFPSVRKAMARLCETPVLLIHGEKDSYIPVAESQALFDRARGPKAMWVAPGAKHNLSVIMHPTDYGRRVVNFLDEHLAHVRRPAPIPMSLADSLEVASSSFVPTFSKNRMEHTQGTLVSQS